MAKKKEEQAGYSVVDFFSDKRNYQDQKQRDEEEQRLKKQQKNRQMLLNQVIADATKRAQQSAVSSASNRAKSAIEAAKANTNIGQYNEFSGMDKKMETMSFSDWMSRKDRPVIETTRQWLTNRINSGAYNNSTNPMLWNQEQRDKPVETWKQKAGEKEQAAAEKYVSGYIDTPTKSMGDVFDYIEELNQTAQKNIAESGNYNHRQRDEAKYNLDRMVSDAADRRENALALADDYFAYEYAWHEDEPIEQQRKALFNYVMGEDYDERVASMNGTEKARLDSSLDGIIDQAKGNRNDTAARDQRDYEIATDLQLMDVYNELIPEVEAEKKRQQSIATYKQWADETGFNGDYDPSLHPAPIYELNDHGVNVVTPQGDKMDQIYFWINNKDAMGGAENSLDFARAEYFMDDEMIDTFNKLYRQYKSPQSTNSAEMFYKALEPSLDWMLGEYQKLFNQATATNNPVIGTLARVMSYPMNVVGGAAGTAGTVAALLGDEDAKKPTSKFYMPTGFTQDVREVGNQVLGQAVKNATGSEFLGTLTQGGLGVADSVLDNWMAMGTASALTGGRMGKTSWNLVQAIMSSEATSAKMKEELGKLNNPTRGQVNEAAIKSIAAGILEGVFERASLERIYKPDMMGVLKNWTNKIIYGLTSAGIEGSEEVFTTAGNIIFDEIQSSILGHESELMKERNLLARNLIDSGAVKDEKDALAQADHEVLNHVAEKVAQDFLAGAAAGGIMGGVHMAGTSIGVRSEGKNIKARGTTNQMIEQALRLPKTSMAYQQASALQKVIEAGQQVTDREVGLLKTAMQAEAAEILESVKGPAEYVLPKVDAARQVVATTPVLAGETRGQVNTKTNIRLATTEDIRQAEGTKTEGTRGLVYLSNEGKKFARLMQVKNATEKNGKDLKLEISVDGKTVEVDPSELMATDYKTAVLMNQMTDHPGLFSAEYVNLLLDEMDKPENTTDAAEVIAIPAQAIRIAAWTNAESVPKTNLNPETAQRLFDASVREAAQRRVNDLKKKGNAKPGTGRVIYKGTEAGTDAFTEATKGLSKQTRNLMGAVAEIARRAGVDVWLADIADLQGEQKKGKLKQFKDLRGLYGIEGYTTDTFNGIVLNIEGENVSSKKFTGTKHHILVTFGHEFQHWLQNNSMEGYNNLQKFVMDEQRKALGGQGQLAARVMEIMDTQGVDLHGAISELVADSCDQIFSNEKVIRHIQDANPGLYTEMKNFVKNLIARIRAAVTDMSISMSSDARSMMKADVNRMAEVFNLAYDEATGRVTEARTETKAAPVVETKAEEQAEAKTEEKPAEKPFAKPAAKVEVIRGKTVDQGSNNATPELKAKMDAQGWTVQKVRSPIFPEYGTQQVRDAKGNLIGTIEGDGSIIQLMKPTAENIEMMKKAGFQGEGALWTALTDAEAKYSKANLEQEYEQAVKSENKEKQREIVDAAAKRAGYVIRAYHGTDEEFTQFNTGERGEMWFGDRPETAYSHRKNTYDTYLKMKNPYVVTYNIGNDSKFDPVEVVEEGRRNGHDGAIVHFKLDPELVEKNVHIIQKSLNEIPATHDFGDNFLFLPHGKLRANLAKPGETLVEFMQRGASETLYNWYVVYKPNQIKSADLITRDNEGHIIQLDRRFNEEKDDFRYSQAQMDQEYEQAVENKDTRRQEQLVAETAQNNGYTEEVYHGTDRFGFTEFDLEKGEGTIFVSYRDDLASTYTRNGKVRNIGISLSRRLAKLSIKEMAKEIASYSADPNTGEPMYDVKHISNKEATETALEQIKNKKNEIGFVNDEVEDAFNVLLNRGTKLSQDDLFTVYDVINNNLWNRNVSMMSLYNAIELLDYANSGEEIYQLTSKNIIGNKKSVIYTTRNETIENQTKYGQGRNRNGIYRLYARPGRQLVVDADGRSWRDIPWSAVIGEETDENTELWNDWEENWYTGKKTAVTREVAAWAKAHGYDSVRINNVWDNGGRNHEAGETAGFGSIGIFFNPNDVKSADPVTYDDNGNVIPLKERFSPENKDIRYSQAEPITNDQGEEVAAVLPGGTVAAARYSYASWVEDDGRQKVINAMKRLGYSKEQIDKYLKDIDSVASIIAEDRGRWDYEPDRSTKYLKKNSDVYKYTLDASTLCAKRLLYQGTFNAIMKQLPNTPLRPGDLIDLANMMYEMGYQTPCGICYVESRRRNTGNAAEQFLSTYKGEYIPNYSELTTTDGLAKLKAEHPQAYDDFIKAMNKRGVGSVKLVQTRTDYRGELRRIGKNTVKYLNSIGGMRIQSFSDFETPHMLDMMQAVLDMNLKGLKAQAYTKVPNFAWIFGPTGIKINLSLMGDVDANGNLIFDNKEGMDIRDAMRLREAYSENVGTILVGKNVKHILAAMADPRIDFIIPFHKSGWTKEDFAKMKTLRGYEDFQDWQNERTITGYTSDGKPVYKNVKSNIDPLSYWNYELSGKENAQIYLDLCKKQGIVPKFNNFLVDNGDGSWSMQPDGSTDGYWKLLIDFKMYNNEGVGAKQRVVTPEFNMEQAMWVLSEYEGVPNRLPVAQPVVERFVREYKENHPDQERYSAVSEADLDVETWMKTRSLSSFKTEDERTMWQAWMRLRSDIEQTQFTLREYKEQAAELQQKDNRTAEEEKKLKRLQQLVEEKTAKLNRLEKEYNSVTGAKGFAAMMKNANEIISGLQGKTQAQVTAAVETMAGIAERAEASIAQQEKELKKLGAESAVKTVRAQLRNRGLMKLVSALRTNYSTSMGSEELEGRVAEIVLKTLKGQDVTADIEALASDVAGNQIGFGNVEAQENLAALRGRTIVIGPGQQAEMKANHVTLKELRERTRGSGIKFEYGNSSTLDTDAEELIRDVPALRGLLDNEKDSLEKFVGFVESMMALKKGSAQENGINQDEVEAFITAMTSIMLNEDAGGMSKADLIAKIRKDAGTIGTALEAVRRIQQEIKGMGKAGTTAATWANIMANDVNAALQYFDNVARLAARQERQQVRKNLIAELKAENTKKLLEQREKYEQQLKNERNTRQLIEENRLLRNKINTSVKRVHRLLMTETDTKNIPEEAKPLARMLVKLFVDHDMSFRRVMFSTESELEEAANYLRGWENQFGKFNAETDLDWLVIGEGETADYEARDAVEDAIDEIKNALRDYRTAEGRATESLQDRRNALARMQKAADTIYDVIQARRKAVVRGRRVMIDDLAKEAVADMRESRFRGERQGVIGHGIAGIRKGIGYANMTPVYFFKNLMNKTLNSLFGNYQDAENKAGLLYSRTKAELAKIAQETGYGTWDTKKRTAVKLEKGDTVNLTLGEMMSIYAIWMREQMNQQEINGPEKSFHLKQGGFYVEEDEKHSIYGREKIGRKAHRMTDADFETIKGMLTKEQLEYVRRTVEFITNVMGEVGNEASMEMFGIKKFNEKWYFPMESWQGVLRSKSTAGTNMSQNSAAHASHSIRRRNNANNALMIRDFTKTVANHVVKQVTYSTFAPAIEWMQRVMNTKITEGDMIDPESTTQRNLWALFQEMYGEDAFNYFKRFQVDMNGGPTQETVQWYDKWIGRFRKSAVAGSLSVALQQPISYIRAAMEISPRWLTEAMNPVHRQNLRQTVAEMREYSGVAVLKQMGKFDMGIGTSAAAYIEPEGMQGRGERIYKGTSTAVTALPEMMDTWTWAHLWNAVKLEQAHENPNMDQNSPEFMQKVTERFNNILRLTQVYDSTLVRSQNMRSKKGFIKSFTSFMAEPTLTANILVDSILNRNEAGGRARMATAGATFLLSAAVQAAVKGLMSAGRNPDKKKTWWENALYRFLYNFVNEVNPFSLIPGYSSAITLMKGGEVSDSALDAAGQIFTAFKKTGTIISGESENLWKDLEDSAGIIAQLYTDIPVKNLSRDLRAMFNFITQPYAQRETSAGVLKYQALDVIHSADNLAGVLNQYLGDAGYQTTTGAYEERIYNATKAKNKDAVKELTEYYTLVKSKAKDPEKTLSSKLAGLAKQDDSISDSEKVKLMKENNASANTVSDYILEQVKNREISAQEARRLLKQNDPKKSDNEIFWQVDRAEYTRDKGLEKTVSGEYYRLYDAIDANRSSDIASAVKTMTAHGKKPEDIKKQIGSKYKEEYLKASGNRKTKLRDALTKAYKAVGLTAEEANALISSWKKE